MMKKDPTVLGELLKGADKWTQYVTSGTRWVKGILEAKCAWCDEPLIKDDTVECSIRSYKIRWKGEKLCVENICDSCHQELCEFNKLWRPGNELNFDEKDPDFWKSDIKA